MVVLHQNRAVHVAEADSCEADAVIEASEIREELELVFFVPKSDPCERVQRNGCRHALDNGVM